MVSAVTTDNFTLADCTSLHAEAILAILNDAILTSTALYDYRPRTLAQMEAWFEAKRAGGYPVIGAFDGDGALMGFASLGSFRPWPGYKYTVEHSVYVEKTRRGRGLGEWLMRRLIERAQELNYHVMIGGIDSSNHASVELHRKLGFEHCATIRQAGFKFGRWLDLVFYQLILPTPAVPVEG
jgi:phosphinothricin acetyltransferase